MMARFVGPPPPAERPATSVEELHDHMMCAARGNDLPLRTVEFPGSRQKTAVFVAVRIPEHHFKTVVPARHMGPEDWDRKQRMDEIITAAQVPDGFEQRHDLEATLAYLTLGIHVPESRLFGQ